MLGEKLREWREGQGLSQTAVGKRLECAREHVGRIETGKKTPSKFLAARIEALISDEECDQITPEDHTPRVFVSHAAVCEEPPAYAVRRSIWLEAENCRLEALLREYTEEKDWGAVKEITTELLNRKITDKLLGD